MSQGLVERQNLEDIADAIRSKNGSSDTYTPAEMAQAISGIHTADEVVLVQKIVNSNGQYNASSDSADGYSGVRVNVPNSYSASDEGKVVSSGNLVAQTTKQITTNGTHDTTTNNSVSVDVPNSYAAADEGKVVSGGALVGQTSKNVNVNGTYDTTENNEVVVNVSGGGGLSDAFMNLDFTKGQFTYGGVVFGSTTGAIFDAQTDYIPLCMPQKNDFTIEVDSAMMQLTSSAHRRFVMPTSDSGFIYRNTGKWSFYNNSWDESNITDGSYFDNSTVGIYIDANNKWHIYRNGLLVYEPIIALGLSGNYNLLMIGSYAGNSINNARITGVRVYIGNYYS